MTSFGQSKSEIYSERAVAKTRNAESGVCCDYPNERRERNQTYTLLNISNSVDQQEERPLECVNGTGWEEAVQSWSKTAPFAYLQLQKKVRKTRASESVNGCLYCIDLIQGLEHEPKAIVQVKSDFSTGAATGGVPDKQQTLPNSNTAANSSSVADDPKKERDCSKVHSGQVPQGGEKKKMTLKEAQPSQSEKKLFVMKDSPLFQAEKKTVPIKEYSIVAPGKPQSLETVKGKELKIQEPPLCSQAGSEVTTRASLVLPPLKDAALRKSLDNSPKKSKIVKSQASEKTFHAFSETVACPQIFKAKEIKCEQRIDRMYDVRKEHIKMQEMASFAPGFSQMPFLVQNLDRCYWHCGFLPDRKKVTMSNSVALRRHGQMSGSHFLQAKGIHAGRAHDLRTRSHMGAQQGDQAKPQEIPLLSGLFPSLTGHSWGRATPFTCCKIQKRTQKPRITKTVSSISHQNMSQVLKKNMACVTQSALDCKRHTEEPTSSIRKAGVSYIKPYSYIPMMTANAEGERAGGKLDSIQTFLGEKRTLPIKEYEIKYSQPLMQREVLRLPKVVQDSSQNNLSCITLNSLLVFKPKRHLESPSKAKAAGFKGKKKRENLATKTVAHSYTTKKGKKNEKKVGVNNTVKKQIQKIMYSSDLSMMLRLFGRTPKRDLSPQYRLLLQNQC